MWGAKNNIGRLQQVPNWHKLPKKPLENPVDKNFKKHPKHKTLRPSLFTALTQKTKKVFNNQTNSATVLKKSGNQGKKTFMAFRKWRYKFQTTVTTSLTFCICGFRGLAEMKPVSTSLGTGSANGICGIFELFLSNYILKIPIKSIHFIQSQPKNISNEAQIQYFHIQKHTTSDNA